MKRPNILTTSVLIMLSFVIILAGMSANFHAVVSNGGKMPVQSRFEYQTLTHFSFQEKDEVNYYLLTDIIGLDGKTFLFYISIGDLLMGLGLSGVLVFAFYLTLDSRDIRKGRLIWMHKN